MTSLATPPSLRRPAAPALDAVADVFARLHEAEIRYCHWKSNEHLAASLQGATDLDVLVDPQAARDVELLLTGTAFKPFDTVPSRAYPGIRSYLGLDARTGRLLHLHLHFRLTLGEKHLKGFRLPWEERVLATRVLDAASGIWVADPNMEFLLLLVRAALKVRWRDWLVPGRGLGRSAAREFRWLAERVRPEGLAALARELVGEVAAGLAVRLADGRQPPTLGALRAFRRAVRPALASFRTYGALEALWRRWKREWGGRVARVARRLGVPTLPGRRVSPHGGVVVAIIGPDGSGKSTLSEALRAWLAPELDVTRIYLGNGKGARSLVRRVLEAAARVVRAVRHVRARGESGKASSAPAPAAARRGESRSWVRATGEAVWALSLARERRRRLRAVRRARNLGSIVLCDRFPQSQYPGLNDGPWFSHWLTDGRALRRLAAQREREAIALAESDPPDLVLRLRVPLDVATARRRNSAADVLAQKAAELDRLKFGPTTRVVELDGSAPLAEVCLAAKRAVWTCL